MIRLSQLSKTVHVGTPNETIIMDKLSLEIPKGQFVTVIGTNGAGKSTLFSMIAGTMHPDQGSIEIASRNVTKEHEHERARYIGRVFQDPMMGTAPHLTVEENLALAMKRARPRGLSQALSATQREAFRSELAQLDLGLDGRLTHPIGMLSGGQRQAITLLMASFANPNLILLDEHTAALDPRTASIVLDLTERMIAAHQLTALMITHDLGHALRYGHRTIMLHKGQVVWDVSGNERKALTERDLWEAFHRFN